MMFAVMIKKHCVFSNFSSVPRHVLMLFLSLKTSCPDDMYNLVVEDRLNMSRPSIIEIIAIQ